jgi:hypothetical protein
MAASAAQAAIDQKQFAVTQAEEAAAIAKSRFDVADADLTDKLRIKKTRDDDKARSKDALTQKEQAKADAEKDVEDALCEVYAARGDVDDANAKRQTAQDSSDSANSDLRSTSDSYNEAITNLNNGTGTPLEAAIAEENAAAAIGSARVSAQAFKLQVDSLKPLLEVLKVKLEAAESAGEQDRLAGEQVDFATTDNRRYELSAKEANDAVRSADKTRDSANDNWELKKQAVEDAKDALEQAQEDASDPKAKQERAAFDCDQAQDQLARCEVSASCDGGDRDPPQAGDCGDLETAATAAALALQKADAIRTSALAARRKSEDDYGAADKAEGVANGKYTKAEDDHEAEVANQRNRESALRAAVTTYRQGVAGLVLAVAGLALALGFFVAAMLATGASFGFLLGGIILTALAVGVAEAGIALAGSQLQSATSSYNDAHTAVALGKAKVANLAVARNVKEKLWHDSEAAVSNALDARTKARQDFDAADMDRILKADLDRDAKLNLKICQARKDAMQ